MAYKLQHWQVTVEYLLGSENTMADALSREERPRRMTPEDHHNPDVNLAAGDVEAGALHEVGQKEKEQDSVGAATPTWSTCAGNPAKGST